MHQLRPFQYAKVKASKLTFERVAEGDSAQPDGVSGVIRYSVLPLSSNVCHGNRDFEATRVHAEKSAVRLLHECRKRAERYDAKLGNSTYVKRVVHDVFVPEEMYRDNVARLKAKYGVYWAANWPEVTDSVKFVYEELSIAAYLLALFELERRPGQPKQTFVDLGCGNGFLTYLLMEEGHPGSGVDIAKRGIWDMYPDYVTKSLFKKTIDPETYSVDSSVDWLIGNHSDELTPWIPVFAARAQNASDSGSDFDGPDDVRVPRKAQPRFFILPCCFFDFDGKKFAFGRQRRTLAVKDTGTGKYAMYLNYIERVCVAFGFAVDGKAERENIRIPSTKYVAILGRRIEFEERVRPKVIREMVDVLSWDARMSRR
jgi:Predicted AdoMet-dependent methyltransferase